MKAFLLTLFTVSVLLSKTEAALLVTRIIDFNYSGTDLRCIYLQSNNEKFPLVIFPVNQSNQISVKTVDDTYPINLNYHNQNYKICQASTIVCARGVVTIAKSTWESTGEDNNAYLIKHIVETLDANKILGLMLAGDEVPSAKSHGISENRENRVKP